MLHNDVTNSSIVIWSSLACMVAIHNPASLVRVRMYVRFIL